ncbi:hypothetical protein A3I99_03185 [Candidatus Kaiserbacteria bacterium RIFCSPLOWO2_02_FULL_45_11b]|uniref:Uncharacterized protein n=1 Tax=Candidatus Kaiserbacteria bacterium RIFCSPLOWO2_12_FULL_45_26 TaxID=1798525 RepID=A0A1F6FG24_9BACT|nr:MAG: hypothetical protein A2Z56_01925 [Candidatus Kaiserbacteria bacterium RIFCSPHIGHO2_12_45_16]OGG69864.1 MAG: hypothetical protein A2929_00045 [Candidatus Kaiserbacteria bacterium RIFCSPLOWO2_01_FULL_45_25]OGG80794.1 MAG: hypothetical protein A3I99_03185 [Candidatus Kaiserbacteria bacterium RIFCSPLOWO2_02_FULL_45_11b]OGG84796.1 MAG: hypothetical protein A3G90_01805 [Candidatus Kaiserbacteria bacterium RIFCSPLOWO2_12_FULL_45_26]
MPNFENPSSKPRSNVERVVGGTAEQQEYIMSDHLSDVEKYSNHKFVNEREKTAEELQMISVAENNVNDLRAKYGLSPVPLPPEKVHIIYGDELTLGNATTRNAGGFEAMNQVIITTDAEEIGRSGIGRFDVIQHESLHAAQYQSLQSSGAISTSYRVGVNVTSRKPDSESGNFLQYLNPLNEAITEENSRRLVLNTSADEPEIGHIIAKRNEEFKEFKDFCENTPNHGYPEALLAGDVLQSKINPETGRPSVKPFAYYYERQTMWKLFDKIYEKNPAAFPDKTPTEAREEIFDMVTKASFDGNIMPFGRLVNNSFGNGTFRDYGHLQTVEDISNFIDALD